MFLVSGAGAIRAGVTEFRFQLQLLLQLHMMSMAKCAEE